MRTSEECLGGVLECLGSVENISVRSGNVLIQKVLAKFHIKVKIFKYCLFFQCSLMRKTSLSGGVWKMSGGVRRMVPGVIGGCVNSKSIGKSS